MPRLPAVLMIVFFAATAGAAAAQAPVSCNTTLYSRFTQLVIRAYEKTQLKLDEVENLSRAAVPFNPFQDVTGTSSNSALKKAFSENLRVLSADDWSRSQRELADWLVFAKVQAGDVDHARVATQDLFWPNSYKNFKRGINGDGKAFVYVNEKGRLASLYLDRGNTQKGELAPTYLEINDLSAGEPPTRVYLGELFSNYFSADVTAEGHLRFAVQVSPSELKIFSWPDGENSYSLKLSGGLALAVRGERRDSTPSNFLHAKNGRTYIAATNHAAVEVFDLSHPEAPVFTWATENNFPKLRLFETSTGRILLSFAHEDRSLRAFDIQSRETVLAVDQPSVVYSQEWHESQDGRIFLSVHAGSALRIYTPLEENKLYMETEVSPAGREENYWLRGKDGHDYNYVMSSRSDSGGKLTQVTVFDVTSKQEIFSRESGNFGAGSPFLSGSYGDPRLVISSATKDREVYVLDPLNPGFPTQTIPLQHPVNQIRGHGSMQKFNSPQGDENLIINGYGTAVLLKLFGRPLP